MNQDNMNMMVCLENFGKKPVDMLLELVQFEAYFFDPLESNFVNNIYNTLKKKYDITIAHFILKKWIDTKFDIRDEKLILTTCKEDIHTYIAKIKQKEKLFNDKIAEIRRSFGKYAKDKYGVDFNNEEIKRVFNQYFYTSAIQQKDMTQNSEKEIKISFVFNNYLKYLWESDDKKKYLSTIEAFGIANQIRQTVINEDSVDKHFLKDCRIFIDTPIMMKTLGYDGQEIANSYEEMVNALQRAGASLAFFEHSFDELWGILFSFKKNIAQNILDAKGVNRFLLARQELRKKEKKELSLDKDTVQNNIEELLCVIVGHLSEKDLNTDFDKNEWVFDMERMRAIIKEHYNNQDSYSARIEKDVKSIAAISRLRLKEGITQVSSYKDAKFFLLTDNYALIRSIKEYYQTEDEISYHNGFNELIFENTILFDLWQNLFDNNNLNKSLLRSKCFAFNEIDDKFKEVLYKICRQMDRYEPEKNVSEQFIAHPEFEQEIYAQTLRTENYDEKYLQRVINNTVEDQENNRKRELDEHKEKINKLEESIKQKNNDHSKDIEEEREKAIQEVKRDLLDRKIKELRLSFFHRLYVFIRRKFDSEFDSNSYYETRAKKILLMSD